MDMITDGIDVIDILEYEEGFREKPYICSEGYATVGYGLKLSRVKVNERDLYDYYDFIISENAATQDLIDKVNKIYFSLELGTCLLSSVFREQDVHRKSALVLMVYQLGGRGASKFRKMLIAMLNADYKSASRELLDSLFAKQTPNRAKRLSKIIRHGDFSAYDELIDT